MSKDRVEAVAMVDRAEEDAPRKMMSFGRFAFEVLVVGALLAGGMYLYRGHVVANERKASLFLEGRDKMKRNDLVSLNEAEKSFLEILEIDRDDPAAVSALAELNFWKAAHGLDTLSKAEAFLKEAKQIDADRADRFAAEAYVSIARGQAAQAENEVRALLERDIAAPKLAHALGWALMEQGKFPEASRIITQAKDADFSNVALPMTLAEMAQRQGNERSAVSHLRGIVKDNMNPNHAWARGWLAALLAKNYGSLTEPAKHIQELRERVERAEKDAAKFAMSPRALGMLEWAEGELALAMGNAEGAIAKAESGSKQTSGYAPIVALRARALVALGRRPEGIQVYEDIVKDAPGYRGVRWDLARLKSEDRDDRALAVIDELEKSDLVATKGPEYEIFRGEHFLRKGNIDEAKSAFTRAAELGDDAGILFGLAKVTFEEEKKKGSKADLDQVGEAFQRTIDKRPTYPEAHEYMGEISLWNFVVDAADQSFKTAEAQYKRINDPIAKVLTFYDRVIRSFDEVKSPKDAKQRASKLSEEWRVRKKDYMASIFSER